MNARMLFRGTGTALVTPFTPDDKVDEKALRRLIDIQIGAGIDALIVLGTTGENPNVSDDERRHIVDVAVEQAAGRVPVVIGTGNNSTRASIEYSRQAVAAGADALLVVGPYYNKPMQSGFYRHVAEIASAADAPIILYNVPGRTSFNFTAETTLRIAADIPQVVGVKEASASIAQISDVLAGRPDGFAVYSGDDEFALPVTLLGGDGVVSVVSNAMPGRFTRMIAHALDGNLADARRLHFEMLEAMRACFRETNPIPIKAALADAGIISGGLRLPLEEISDANRERVLEVFRPLIEK